MFEKHHLKARIIKHFTIFHCSQTHIPFNNILRYLNILIWQKQYTI